MVRELSRSTGAWAEAAKERREAGEGERCSKEEKKLTGDEKNSNLFRDVEMGDDGRDQVGGSGRGESCEGQPASAKLSVEVESGGRLTGIENEETSESSEGPTVCSVPGVRVEVLPSLE